MMRLTSDAAEVGRRPDSRQDSPSPGRLFQAYIGLTAALACLALGRAIWDLQTTGFDYRLPILFLLTIASGRYSIRLPARAITVGVSEVFVFATILLFGAGPATIAVAVDGIIQWYTRRDQPVSRSLFSLAEPVISTWSAAQIFVVLTSMLTEWTARTSGLFLLPIVVSWIPTVTMTAVYVFVNSVLMSLTLALEAAASAWAIWKHHALPLAINYYAAASLATLGVGGGSSLSLAIIGMVVPLLVLSTVAYREAATRVEQARQHVSDIEDLYHSTIEALVMAVDIKDQVTHGHIRRVQRHAVALARAMGITDEMHLKAIDVAAVLHDVGKLAVPDYVLNKPSSLSFNEFEVMKQHAEKGACILTAVKFPYPVVPIVRHHHESWNGRGYPDGLRGDDIPIGARVLAVVDCFDALTSHRPYRRKLRDHEAIDMIAQRSGTAYDPKVVERFIALVPELRRQDVIADEALKRLGIDDTKEMRGNDGAVSHAEVITQLQRAGSDVLNRLGEQLYRAEACLFAVSPANTVLFAALATPDVQAATAELVLPIGEGLSGWVAANRHTIINSDPGLDFGDDAIRLGLRSATSTPVFACGMVVAVLTVYLSEYKAFSDRQGRFIGILAQEVGTALVRQQLPEIPKRESQMPHSWTPASMRSAPHRSTRPPIG